MKSKKIALVSLFGKSVNSRVFPDIRTVTAEFAELNIVAMSGFAVPEDEDKLMARSIEGAHAAVVLDPDTQVEQGVIYRLSCCEDFFRMAPIHANEVDGTLFAIRSKQSKALGEEGGEFG
jgi:hypothetical protein